MTKIPTIAIVGRPNVGKSTLFNKLIEKRYAITSHIPGTTRDRISQEAHFGKYTVLLIDTGGLMFGKKNDIEEDVYTQARIAIEDADLIYFVIDASSELTASDFEATSLLRKSEKPVFLIANKCDRKVSIEERYNLYELGFGDFFEIAALQEQGLDALKHKTEQLLRKNKYPVIKQKKADDTIGIAFLGRPNVGKSSLVNALLGENRTIVSDTPGTTIDTIDTELVQNGQRYNLIDTAGLRRRGKIGSGGTGTAPVIERYSSFRALQAIYRADVSLLILDYSAGVNKQDCHVSQYVLEAGKGLIIVVNKSDLMPADDRDNAQNEFIKSLMRKMSYVPWAPVIFVSALTKENIPRLFELTTQIHNERQKQIQNQEVQNFITYLTAKRPPPSEGKRFIHITDVKQTNTNPPEFTFLSNRPDAIHFSYRRFIENELRKKYGFTGTAVRLRFRTQFDR